MKVGGQKDSSKRMMDHIISSFFQPCMAELLSANSPYFFFSSPHSHPHHKITSMPSMKSFRLSVEAEDLMASCYSNICFTHL